MIKKIEYKFAIGRNSDSVLLKQISNGLNAVAAVDTSRLNGSIYNITKTGVVNYNRQIKIIKETIKGTTFKANTSDVLLTNVYDKDQTPLYYKAVIRRKFYKNLYVNDVKIESYDDNFLYTNDIGPIKYEFDNGNTEIINDDFYPVFVDFSDVSMSMIADMDGRIYKHQIIDGEFIILTDSLNMSCASKNKPLLNMSEYSSGNLSSLNLYIDTYSFTKSLESNGTSYKLEYIKPNTSMEVLRVLSERAYIDGDYIVVQKDSIYDLDIEIVLKDSSGKDLLKIDNSNNIFDNKNVFCRSGKIYAPSLIESFSTIGYSYISVNYNYINYKSNNMQIPKYMIKNISYISIGILPDYVQINNSRVKTNNPIVYFIFDKFDNLIYQNYVDNKSVYKRILGYGFGQEGYSENGYSGYIEDENLEEDVRVKAVEYPASGYSEYHYSFGPFGGISIDNRDVLDKISADNGSPVGYIELCKIYQKDKSLIDVIINDRLSIPRAGSNGIRKIEKPTNTIYSIHAGPYRESVLDAGVNEVLVSESTRAVLTKHIQLKDKVIFKLDTSFDISKHTSLKYVTDPKAITFKKDTSRMNDRAIDKYKMYGYNDYGWEIIDTATFKDTSEGVFIAVDIMRLSSYHYVGIGYNSVSPSRYILI